MFEYVKLVFEMLDDSGAGCCSPGGERPLCRPCPGRYRRRMKAELSGRVIVVVGGTSGLGLSACRACVAAGAQVVAVGRDPGKAEAVLGELGDAVRVVVADATHPGTAEAAIAAGLEAWGGFHGLYHVAGGSGRRMGDGPLHVLSEDGWDYTMNLNLRSVFLSNRAAVRRFRDTGTGGSILNCGSVLGHSPSSRYFATHAYAAAKAAMIGMTRSAASQYAAEGIRFNLVAPALVATPMSQRAQGDARILEFVKTKQPLDGGRIGVPEDLDAAVVWLLSNASRFVTGQVVSIDGGWSVSEGQVGAESS
jgi:NAD(P)-dependent dehydrogenase (short-subunit alcohol dehydrogenase family)